MVHLLSDLSGVEPKAFGTIKLLNNRSYFEIDKKYEQGLSDKFDGVEFEGRAIRVHPDNGPSNSSQKSSGFHKKKSKNRRPSERRDSRKSSRRKRR